MTKTSMATPFADPRTAQLYFRRAVPEVLRLNGGLSGPQRLILTFMERDAAVGGRCAASSNDIYPPAILAPLPPATTNWAAVLADKARFQQTGTNWIRARWHTPEEQWMQCLAGPVARLRAFDVSAARFADDDLAKALRTCRTPPP